MQPGADQVRLAIGVFDEPENLCGALLSLADDGFQPEQFCLVARAATLVGFDRLTILGRLAEDRRQYLARLRDRIASWPTSSVAGTADEHGIVATSSPVLSFLLQAPVAGGRSTAGLPAEPVIEIEAQAIRGAIVLVIRAMTPAQQRRSTRTLLDTSLHSVKTYDFTIPASPHPAAGQ